MPLYEYKCPDCSTTGERILRVDEREGQTCPVCDGPWELRVSVPRLISGEFPAKVRMSAFPGAPEVTDKDELRYLQDRYGTRTLEAGEAVGPEAVKAHRERSLRETREATEQAVDAAMNSEQFRGLEYGPERGDPERPWKDPAVEKSGGFQWVPRGKTQEAIQPTQQ